MLCCIFLLEPVVIFISYDLDFFFSLSTSRVVQENQTVCSLEARATSPVDRGGVSEAGGGRDSAFTGGAEEVLQQPRVQPVEGSFQASVPKKVSIVTSCLLKHMMYWC